jgi:hypothetical protein
VRQGFFEKYALKADLLESVGLQDGGEAVDGAPDEESVELGGVGRRGRIARNPLRQIEKDLKGGAGFLHHFGMLRGVRQRSAKEEAIV